MSVEWTVDKAFDELKIEEYNKKQMLEVGGVNNKAYRLGKIREIVDYKS